jgi:hypothetical protein
VGRPGGDTAGAQPHLGRRPRRHATEPAIIT